MNHAFIEPVRIIKSNFLEKYVNSYFGEDPVKGRQVSHGRIAAPFHQMITGINNRKSNDDLIEQYLGYDFEKSSGIDRLVSARLDLVTAQCDRPIRYVEESVDSTEEPVHDERQSQRSCENKYNVCIFFS